MGFRLLTAEASSVAHESDALFFSMLGLSTLVIVVIVGTALTFMYRYRAGSKASREGAGKQRHWLEFTWILIPLALFLGIFWWAASLYSEYFFPPSDAMNIYVVAKQWIWKIQHPNGLREINSLHVPEGRAVKLLMTSEDVIHSFYVPAFRLKRDVLPGRYTTFWFKATKASEYHLFCAEYCGTDHARMRGKVIVMKPRKYSEWLEKGSPETSMAASGKRLFQSHGCSGCHGASSTVHAPKLQGLFGRPVPLQSGSIVMADENYIRDSILLPRKQIAAGYPPIMPSFKDQLTEAQIMQLIAYIKSISNDEDATP